MLEDDVVLHSKNDPYDCIEGYTSDRKCDIRSYDILVKIGEAKITQHVFGISIEWNLCHVCHDKGWEIPILSPDAQKLLYYNKKNQRNKRSRYGN